MSKLNGSSIILIFVLTTNLSFASVKDIAASCKISFNKLAQKVIQKKIQKPFQVFKSSEIFSDTHKEKIFEYAKNELSYTKIEMQLLEKAAATVESKALKEEFYSFIVYSKSLNPKKRLFLLESAEELTLDRSKASGVMKKFYNIGLSIDKKSLQEYNGLVKTIEKKQPHLNKSQVDELAIGQVKVFRRAYEKMSFGCRSNIWTAERTAAKNAFLKFKLGIGLVSSIGAYSYHNQDKFKEDKKKWAYILGYELTFSVFSSYISTGIISNPSSSIIIKGGAKYINARAQGLVDWGLYAKLFGGSDADAIKKINEIKKDKEKMKLIKELSLQLKNEYSYRKYKKLFYEAIKPMLIHNQSDQKLGHRKAKEIDWENLTLKDPDNHKVNDALVKASLAQTYEESKGEILDYGSVGSDRFMFHAGYGALMLPRDLAFDLYIYHILCMGALNPKQAFLKALGLYVMNRIVFDQLYYFSRKETINQ